MVGDPDNVSAIQAEKSGSVNMINTRENTRVSLSLIKRQTLVCVIFGISKLQDVYKQ